MRGNELAVAGLRNNDRQFCSSLEHLGPAGTRRGDLSVFGSKPYDFHNAGQGSKGLYWMKL